MHFALALFAVAAVVSAAPIDSQSVELFERASCSTPPAGGGTSDTPWVICKDFDGKGATYDTKTVFSCNGEAGTTGAVFIVQNGATVKNVVIGSNQREGIHCAGPCTIDNVTIKRVCEDSLTVDGSASGSVTFKNIHILSGGKDKIIQHNGPASLTLQNIRVDNHNGKVYRSCGDGGCGGYKGARRVSASGITVGGSGQEVFGVNKGDTINFSGVTVSNGRSICKVYSNGSKIGDCKQGTN
ncbi:pectate lyase-domain-containing protein [Cladochytrium replicatum]|nr:pectate lyase-domain-containing protein [Cladochytrium replicatum]